MPHMASTSMSTTARSTATSSAFAKNSRRWTTSSGTSKPSMASATGIATTDTRAVATDDLSHEARERLPAPDAAERALASAGTSAGQRLRWRLGLGGLFVSPLSRRIIALNVLPLALLAVGFLYLGKFEASLIGQRIESLHTQGEIFAAALSEGAVLESADEGEN